MGLNCRQLHDHLGLPLVPIVQSIGYRGIPIDLDRRDLMLQDIAVRVMGIDNELAAYGLSNVNSDRQLGDQLKAMGVPLTERTDKNTQWKVDAEVLGRMNYNCNTRRVDNGKQPLFPFLPSLIKRSRLTKAAENIRALGVCDDGLLRTALKACHTRTARYASSGFGRKGKAGWCPICRCWGEHGTNLQNITRGCSICGSGPRLCTCDGGGIHLKSLFTASPRFTLGEWDYAALELRIMAYRIQSDKLVGRLERGEDLHTLHAQLMFPGQDITKRRRTLAKNFIYAIRGAGGNRAVQIVLAKQGEYIALEEIEGWRQAIFAEYPEIPAWIRETDAVLNLQAERGERRVIRNAFGRPRVLLGNAPLKEALANEISGTAADIMSFVALRLAYEQPDIMRYVVMQIHDSLLVHAPDTQFNNVMQTLQHEMEKHVWHWGRFVRYPVEGKFGTRWSDLTDWPGV